MGQVGENFRPLLSEAEAHGQSRGKPVHITTASSMSKTPTRLGLPTPCRGEHSVYVCKELLGMADAEMDELVMANVFV